MLSDSHLHLSGPLLYPGADQLIASALEQGIDLLVNVCTDPLSLERGLELRKEYRSLLNMGAVPPDGDEGFFEMVEIAARGRQLVAIGETGLDYYREGDKDKQKSLFIRHLQLAIELELPVAVHCREAFADLCDLLDEHYGLRPLIVHCFTGSLTEMWQIVERGYLISFSGIVTFAGEKLERVVKEVLPGRYVLETDAPYLAPKPHRGKVCRPTFIWETAKWVAKVRGMGVEQVAEETSETLKGWLERLV